jgi:hypothetical protein
MAREREIYDFDSYENNFGNEFEGRPLGYGEEPVLVRSGGGGGGGGYTPPPKSPSEPKEVNPPLSKPAVSLSDRIKEDIIRPIPPIETYEIEGPKPFDLPPVRVKGGCTDPKAENFDRSATYDNGKCVYKKVEILKTFKDSNAPVALNILVDRGPSEVFVNDKSVGTTRGNGDFNNLVLNFTEKELLTPKTITVKKTGFKSADEWRIKSVLRSIEKEIKPLIPLTINDPQVVQPDLPPTRPITRPNLFAGGLFGDNIGDKQFFGGTGFGEFNTDVFRGGAFEGLVGNINPSRTSGGNQLLGFNNRFPLQVNGFGNTAVPNIAIANQDRVIQSLRRRSQLIDRQPAPTIPILRLPPIPLGLEENPLVPPTIKPLVTSIGKTTFNYYDIELERKIDGKWVQQPNANLRKITDLNLRAKAHNLKIGFSLRREKIKEPEPPTVESVYKIRIIGDVPTDESILWRTNYGQVGTVLDDDDIVIFEIEQQVGDPRPKIEFRTNGITEFTHRGEYEFSADNGTVKSNTKGLEKEFELLPGTNDIVVRVIKEPVTDIADKPAIAVANTNLILNIANPQPLRINYKSADADKVVYTLGKVKKAIPINGTLTLTKEDFPNGVGRYTIYLQPSSVRGGSGDVEKVIVNVENKQWLPGPDITHINYPQNLKGADFKGYNVDFDISWQSINTNYVNAYIGKITNQTFLGKLPPSGATRLNVKELIRKAKNNIHGNRDILQFELLFVPWNEEGNEKTTGKVERVNITFDKGDLTLRRGNVVGDIRNAFIKQWDLSGFDDYISPYLTHYLHLGDADNKLIGTWGIDNDTFSEFRINPETNQQEKIPGKEEKAIVLKLYEPLPRSINTNDKVWISKVQSIPIVDRITITDDIVNNCTPLTPNFDLDVTDDIGYQILDDLITSGSATSADIVSEFVSGSNFSLENLNISFVSQSTVEVEVGTGLLLQKSGVEDYNWKEFVKYSSAGERVQNFYYKVKLLEAYESKIDTLNALTGSVGVSNETKKVEFKIGEVKRGFDAFEKYLYNTSGSLTYPGAGLNELSSSEDSSVISWYAGILNSAQNYDEYNTSRLALNLPKHIIDDNNNSDFILFFDMIGQHFDILWTHIRSISKTNKLENKYENGIDDTLLYHMLESLGWNADMGVQSQALWEYAFGKDSDGTSISSMSGKDRQHQIWRRLLNNLPYLNKHKGTKRAVHAALSCYGVPASLLTIMEFGGPKDPTTSGTTKFSFEDRTAAILISGSNSISTSWKEFSNDYSTDYPNSVELRFNTEERQNQEIIKTDGWSVHLIKNTGSLARVQFKVSGSGTIYSASTELGSFYNDEYTQLVINKDVDSGDDTFTIYAKEGFQERIRTNVSASLTISGVSSWKSGSSITIGGDTFTGSVDEFRLWRTPLSESKVDNHTLMPDAIDGNHISASTVDLIFRNDFEYPKNRNSDVNVKNVSFIQSYETASVANNFDSISSYPYHYVPYDRDVTAVVPSSGTNYGNKIRFETQTLISDLNYKVRATKKSLDQAPIDSSRLGMFFSPTKEINMDILKSLGDFNIDNYIGDPSDEYSHEYKKLNELRNYYFDRFTLNIYEYIQLIRYIDKSLFNILEGLVPARAQISTGLLIEPHILERSKTQWKPTTADKKDFESRINVNETELSTTKDDYVANVDANEDTILIGEKTDYLGTIDTETSKELEVTKTDYSGVISTEDDTTLSGVITRNSGSTMGGFEITIDNTDLGVSLQGQFESDIFQQIGNDPESLAVAGFGVYGTNGNSIRTRLDGNKNYIKERVKIFLLKQSYTEDVPQNIDSNDPSRGREFVTQTKYRHKVSILPFTGSDGLETSTPSGDDIVSATPLDGYFPLHYRNVGDLTSGLENSFFNGSKQTSATTIDGGSPVVTFTTNPNTLRVSDTGRGSGEPILEVD